MSMAANIMRLRELLVKGVPATDSGWYVSDYTPSGLSLITDGLSSGIFPIACEGPQAALIVEAINALPELLTALSDMDKAVAGEREREELQDLRLTKLLEKMRDISEDCWCAGWISGNENALYRMAFLGGDRRYGMGEVDQVDLDELKRLAEATGRWWIYGDDGEEHVSLAEFAAIRSTAPASGEEG